MIRSEILTVFQDWPTWLLAAGLMVLMSGANDVGFRLGRRRFRQESEPSRAVFSILKVSVFALVGLLLGFSFSATTNRDDMRQRVVLDQANAVGTCYLRAGLLAEPHRGRLRDDLRGFLTAQLAVAAAGNNSDEITRQRALIDRSLSDLWADLEAAFESDAGRVHQSQLVGAVNAVIDLSSTRAWAGRNHLPDTVLVLLVASVFISSILVGHSSGLSGVRHVALWVALNLGFALVLFVVLDLDRPRRGLIRVDQTALGELRSAIEAATQPEASDLP